MKPPRDNMFIKERRRRTALFLSVLYTRKVIDLFVSIINLYLFPYIALKTMSGDKTDIIMGMAFGFVPLGWFIISLLYGIATRKMLIVSCSASILCLPLLFIRSITGETIVGKLGALLIILVACFFITMVGTFIGGLIGKAIMHFRTK